MEPLPGILDRDVARANAQANVPALLETVREMVNEGTHLFGRLLSEANRHSPPRTFHTALLLLFRHTLELLDAVDELFRAGIFAPSSLQVRGILEAYMQILYLFGMRTEAMPSPLSTKGVDPVPRDTVGTALTGQPLEDERDKRGLAYIVREYRQLAEDADNLEQTVLQQRSQKYGMSTLPAAALDPAVQAGLKAEAAKLRAQLATPEFAPIDAEFTSTRGKGRFDPAWYELRCGPRNVRALSDSVGLAALYDLFYGEASQVMHGTNIGGQLGAPRVGGGHTAAPLRNFAMAAQVGRRVLLDVMPIYQLAIRALRPADMARWNEWTGRWAAVAAAIH